MSRDFVISIDAMGGDRGPAAIVDGMARSARKNNEIGFIVHGDAEKLEKLVRKRGLADICQIRNTPDVVAMDEKPSVAMRKGRDSSMWHTLQAVATGEARVALSSGNTGALMAMSMLVLRKAPGVDRPAIAVLWPAEKPQGFNVVLDMGADVRADPRNLLEYAVMGAEYARLGLGIQQPRVGLLNVGTEKTKGRAQLAEADDVLLEFAAREGADLTYRGYVEGNDIPGDKVDVVVTDGFTGNIALKTAEGTAAFIRKALKDAFAHSPLSRFGALFALTSLKRMQRRIDPRRVNGGVFLGLNGAVVKSHGGADATGFSSAIKLAFQMAKTDFSQRVAQQVAKLAAERDTPGAESGAVRGNA